MVHGADQGHAIGAPAQRGVLAKTVAVRTVADDRKARGRKVLPDLREGVDDQAVALVLDEVPDRQEQRRAVDVELPARVLVRKRPEPLQVNTVSDDVNS